MSYANKIGQVKQSQTKSSSTKEIIASKPLYDFSGKSVGAVMGAPINQFDFKYKDLLASYKNGTGEEVFRDKHFDSDDNYEAPNAMSGDANDYWSDANPDSTIPSAEGYPYNRSIYYGDGSGAIKEQGGVGASFKINNTGPKRTVRTYFSKVANQELIRVFGDEAPDAKSVRKIITVDPNNEISIQYVGKEGVLYATCLSGHNDSENLVDALESAGETFEVSYEFDWEDNIPFGEFGITASYPLYIDAPNTKLSFDYEINADMVEAACEAAQFCSRCDYKVLILLHKEDGTSDTLLSHKINSIDCNNSDSWNPDDWEVNIDEPGFYIIEKRVETNNLIDEGVEKNSNLQSLMIKLYENLSDEIYGSDGLGTLKQRLEDNDLKGFWEEMNVDFDNPPDLGELVTKNFYCGTFTVPFEMCEEMECSSINFLQFFDMEWTDSLPNVVGVEAGTDYIKCFGVDQKITKQDFNTLIQNMLKEKDDNGELVYNCSDLFACWTGLVKGYKDMKELYEESALPFNFFQEFINCAGTMYVGSISNQSSDPNYFTQYNYTQNENFSSARDGFILKAYKYFEFNYSASNNALTRSCLEGIQNEDGSMNLYDNYFNGPGWIPLDDDFGPDKQNNTWQALFSCTRGINIDININDLSTIQSGKKDVEGLCIEICGNKEYMFQEELKRAYHNQGITVEGDPYTLVLNDDPTSLFKYVYSEDSIDWGTPTPSFGGGPFFTPLDEINCQAISLVESCQAGCVANVSELDGINQIGDQDLADYFNKIINYRAEVKVGGACGPEFNEITSNPDVLFDGNNTPDLRWKKTFDLSLGGADLDEPYFMKLTKDENLIIIGLTSSVNSGTVLGDSDEDLIVYKVSPSGTIIWQRRIKVDGTQRVTDCELDNLDNVFISISTQTGINNDKTTVSSGLPWLVRINSEGKINNQTNFGNIYGYALKLDRTESGKVFFLTYGSTSPNGLFYLEINELNADLTSKLVYTRNHAQGFYHNIQNFKMINDNEFILEISESNNGDYFIEKNIISSNITSRVLLDDVSYLSPGAYERSGMLYDSERNIIVYSKMQDWVPATNDKANNFYFEIDYSNLSFITKKNFYGFQSGHIEYNTSVVKNRIGNYVVATSQLVTKMYPNNGNSLTPSEEPGNGGVHSYWTYEVDFNSKNVINDRMFFGENWQRFTDSELIKSESADKYFYVGISRGAKGTGTKDDELYGNGDMWLVGMRDYCSHQPICFRWVDTEINLDNAFNVKAITCEDNIIDQLKNTLNNTANEIINAELEAFEASYKAKCAAPKNIDDKFTVKFDLNYHHYMTYFYDRTGRKVRTVPPAGNEVILKRQNNLNSDKYQSRNVSPIADYNGNLPYSSHYYYNSLNNLTKSYSPDGGLKVFVYDNLERLKASQDAQQRTTNDWSYVIYDNLSRPIEVGVMKSSISMLKEFHVEDSNWPSNVLLGNKREVITTKYSVPANISFINGEEQKFLQNRVSYIKNNEGAATYFSYDVHGNVNWLVQKIPDLGLKYISYEYDVLTNKVTSVNYNPGEIDQFFHQYEYDQENRLTKVFTSKDGTLWDMDAQYEYYLHGPLKRNVIGEDKVQGIDFVYNINGWLKGINHPDLITNDPGNDGSITGADAFGMVLGYFQNDFMRTGSPFNNNHSYALGANLGKSANDYKYDQLQRIKKSSFNYFSNNSFVSSNDYQSSYKYDPNGNITELIRSAYSKNGQSNDMDNFEYYYQKPEPQFLEAIVKNEIGMNSIYTNKLLSVKDSIPDNGMNWGDIFPGQNFDADLMGGGNNNNYIYDKLGRLVKDIQEGIHSIDWTVTNKVKKIEKTNGQIISFQFDPAGNKMSKTVTGLNNSYPHIVTYYVRDAAGNVMSNYKKIISGSTIPEQLQQTEIPIYGSKRIGVFNVKEIDQLTTADNFSCLTCDDVHFFSRLFKSDNYGQNGYANFSRAIGKKQYQHEDHLGNIRVVFTDRKIKNGTKYNAEVISYSNYYPFGMQMPGRHSQSDYRYGFNGAEKNEELGKGLDYDLGARMYNSKLGRMFSSDPREAEYPWQSTYAYYMNSPVGEIDVNGEGGDGVSVGGTAKASAAWVFGSDGNKGHFNFGLMGNLTLTSDYFQLDIGLNQNIKNGGLGFPYTKRGKPRYFGSLYAAGTLALDNSVGFGTPVNLWHAESEGSLYNPFKSSLTYAQQVLFSSDKLSNYAVQRIGTAGFKAVNFLLTTYEDHKYWGGDHGDRWLGTGGGYAQLAFNNGSMMRFGFDIMTGNADNTPEALQQDIPTGSPDIKWKWANQSKFDPIGNSGYNVSLNAGRTFFSFITPNGNEFQYATIGRGQMHWQDNIHDLSFVNWPRHFLSLVPDYNEIMIKQSDVVKPEYRR